MGKVRNYTKVEKAEKNTSFPPAQLHLIALSVYHRKLAGQHQKSVPPVHSFVPL